MRRLVISFFKNSIIVVFLLVLVGCRGTFGPSQEKTVLWNGKDFSGWKLFVPDETIDVNTVWTIKNGDIYCIGKPNGYLRTKLNYSNYKLHLEWRWLEEPTNSGVLLHASGPDKVWPRCIEAQLMSGHAGDFVLIGGTGITVEGRNKQNVSKQYVVVPKKHPSNEKPAGEWNVYDIYCKDDTIRLYVNGLLQNQAAKATKSSGWICLQSEGSPISFRNIYIELLN